MLQQPAQVESIISTGKNAILCGANALSEMANSLTEEFAEVVRLISNLKGQRVIVSGIGKSGHIAKKIAATFSSTGTPSFYIHPTEASHGDLGMIRFDDIIIIISKSGESQELSDIVNYCRRHSIILIAITADKNSTLGKTATKVLCIPNHAEAQPLGVAPTTSTLCSLSLGDALALAVLETKNFQIGNFREFHPGGKLGRKLMRVKDIMHSGKDLPIVHLSDTIGAAVLEMTRTRFGCVGVVDDGKILRGIFTDGDLRRHFSASAVDKEINTLMTKNPKEINADALVSDVAHLFSAMRIPSVFVTEDHVPVGIVHMHDLLQGNFL